MDLLEYTPKDESFKGLVKLRMPNYKERLKLVRECNFSSNEDGMQANDNALVGMEKLYDHLEERIEHMDLFHVETGTEIKDLETLGSYLEGSQLINELSGQLINGRRLGNG